MASDDPTRSEEALAHLKKVHEYRKLYALYLGHCNAHDFEAMQSFYSFPTVGINDEQWSPEKVTAQFRPLVSAFPDWRWEMRNLAVEGDFLALHFRVSGTHHGTFHGIQPTGRVVAASQFTLYHVVDGRFAEVWDLVDTPAILKQIT